MIEIVLAAHNGERFLDEQLHSLLLQSETDWRLLAMDDGSTDGTLPLLKRYAREYPEQITVLPNESPAHSAADTFLQLIAQTKAPYVMCCDQDDVWHADKIRLTLAKMRELEERRGAQTPLLVHTDLAVADEHLRLLAPSFVRYQRLKPKVTAFPRLLCQNNVTGCTVMANAALCRMLPPKAVPEILMHDWWMALVASAFGEIGYIGMATVSYRQHGKNAIGAKDTGSLRYNAGRLKQAEDVRNSLERTYAQAEAFLAQYRTVLDDKALRAAESYVKLPALSKPLRMLTLVRGGFLKHDLKRMIGQLLFV